jgi:hypothetical protein
MALVPDLSPHEVSYNNLTAGIPNLKPITSEYEAFNLKNDETSL